MSIKTELVQWLSEQDDPAVLAQIAQVRDWNDGGEALSQAQMEELQHRITLLDQGKMGKHSWEDVKAYVRQRYHGQS